MYMIHLSKKIALFITILVIIAITTIIIILSFLNKNNLQNELSDLNNELKYKEYTYGNSENIIDIGIQPLWLPVNLITSLMQKDLILKEQMISLGKEIRFHSFLKGADVNNFIIKGELEGGFGGDMPAIYVASMLNIIIPVMVQFGNTSIVAKNHMELSQLKGKRIGYPFGSIAHFSLLRSLSGVDLNEEDVTLIPLDINEMSNAMKNNKIDAFSAWEPIPAATLILIPGSVIIHKSLSIGFMYFRKEYYLKYPEVIEYIIASEIRAFLWLKKNRNNLLETIKQVYMNENVFKINSVLSNEQIAILAEEDLIGFSYIPEIPDYFLEKSGHMTNEFLFLKKFKKIPEEINWERIQNSIDKKILINVVAESEKFNLEKFNYSNDEK